VAVTTEKLNNATTISVFISNLQKRFFATDKTEFCSTPPGGVAQFERR
jgi:hypothetical protein